MKRRNILPKPLSRSQLAFKNAFITLLQSEDFKEIKVSELLNTAGYSRASFYGNYEDKYDWAKKILQDEMQVYVYHSVAYTSAVQQNKPTEQVIAALTKYMEYIYKNQDLYRLLLERRIPAPPVEQICIQIREIMNDYVDTQAEDISEDFDPEFYNYIQICSSFLQIEYWKTHNFAFTPEQMARKIYVILKSQPYSYQPLNWLIHE